MTIITIACISAIIGFIYVDTLADSKGILSFMPLMATKYLPSKIAHLFHCGRCVAGQVALWYYLIAQFHTYNIVEHVVCVVLSIFMTTIIGDIFHNARRK